ncbi:hypothetical protein F3Y22_tig00013960pilonHSYRG00003 [Hibiscus syriacus]|uniref:Trichome birefringence-like C-terminal domain-containing protein n=1 Tax=Hibiscus syriacus TaxID=106335 RepID=A0A6A3C0D4_HIBSY|nr:hypothetical protein F3Y22_tig00013960pilonHSYRG00003 [Hibiscus syriacus]
MKYGCSALIKLVNPYRPKVTLRSLENIGLTLIKLVISYGPKALRPQSIHWIGSKAPRHSLRLTPTPNEPRVYPYGCSSGNFILVFGWRFRGNTLNICFQSPESIPLNVSSKLLKSRSGAVIDINNGSSFGVAGEYNTCIIRGHTGHILFVECDRNVGEVEREEANVCRGFSLNRVQWISMVCLLQSVIPADKKTRTPNPQLTIFRAEEYNATVEFFWAPLLVESNSDDLVYHRYAERIIRLDSVLEHSS